MEYVVYLSKSKIDMLYDQLHSAKGKTSIEGSFNIGVASGKISKESKDEPNYYEKLNLVTTHIQNEVGSAFDETVPSYFSNTLPLKWRIMKDVPEATYWVGEYKEGDRITNLLLIGSSQNINGRSVKEGFGGYSAISIFMRAYRKMIDNDEMDEITVRNLPEPPKLEMLIGRLKHYGSDQLDMDVEYRFLAKRLAVKDIDKNEPFSEGIHRRYILATPLFVSEE